MLNLDDFSVKVYLDDQLRDVSFFDLVGDQRVLISSVCRLTSALSDHYLFHLAKMSSLYQNAGINKIIILDSCNGVFALSKLSKIENVLAVSDVDSNFVKALALTYQKAQPIRDLRSYWSFQVLLNKLDIEQFYEQPTENRFLDLVAHYKNDQDFLKRIKPILQLNEDLFFNRPELTTGPEHTYDYGGKIFYYNLWPNTALNKSLGLNI